MEDIGAKCGMGLALLLFTIAAAVELSHKDYKVAAFYAVIMAIMVYLFNRKYGEQSK